MSEINKDVKNFLTNALNLNSEIGDDVLWDILDEIGRSRPLQEKITARHHVWWDELEIIIEVDGKHIAYPTTQITGNADINTYSPDYSTIRLVKACEQIITKYK